MRNVREEHCVAALELVEAGQGGRGGGGEDQVDPNQVEESY